MRTLKYLVVVGTLLALAMSAGAQQRFGNLEGRVVDQQGQPLPGTTVTLSGANMMGQRVAITDEGGKFRFVLIPPGQYAVEASLSGFQSMKEGSVPVSLGQTAKLEFRLPQGKFAETLQVTADQVLVDTTKSSVGANIVGDFVGKLANDRQYQMVMSVLPGAIEANNPYMHGSAGSDNMYLVDGADSTDPMTRTWSAAMNFDNLQEVQVISGGAQAEYGRGTGAVVNLVTKSGSNELHGVARYTYSDENRNSKLRGDRYYFSDATKYTSEKRPSINLGGPIAKDKLWFFTSYEKRDKTKLIARYLSLEDALARNYKQGETPYKGHYLTGKLTFQPKPEHTFFVNYMEDPIDIPMLYAYLGYQNRTTSADNLREQGGWAVIADWTGVLSTNSFLNVKYNQKSAPLNNLPNTVGTTYYSPAGGGVYWGGSTSDYRTNRKHKIYSATYSHFLDTGRSNHELKGGIEYAKIDLAQYSESYPGNELIAYKTDGTTPDYRYVYRQRRGWIPTTNETWTAFVQDSWRVTPDFTINLGLRLENAKDKTSNGIAVLNWGWGDRIQPRLGFAYNLKGNNLHGSFGRYHDTMSNTVSRTFSPVPDLIYDESRWDAKTQAWKPYATWQIAASKATRDNLKSPYMDEATVGYQAKLSSSMAFGVDAIWREWRKGIEDDDGRDYPGNPAGDGNYHYFNLDKFRSYKGLEFSLKKMLSGGKFQFLASYTYSKTESYWDDTDQAGSYADNPYNFYHYWGPTSFDFTHVVKFNGSYLLPFGFSAGANFVYMSGPPWTQYGTVAVQAGTFKGRRFGNYFISERGANRLPDTWRLDLRLEWEHKFGPVVFGLYLDTFNVTDNQEAVSIDGNVGRINLANDQPGATWTIVPGYTNAQYGKYTQWQAPRSYFAGVKFEF